MGFSVADVSDVSLFDRRRAGKSRLA